MVSIPILVQGPFSLDLDKSVRYVTFVFKGISCGVVISTIVAMVLLEFAIMDDNSSADAVTTMNRQLLLCLCICGFALAYFFLCSYLYKGVEERNRSWIFPWFIVTSVVGFGLIIVFFVSFTNGFGIIQLVLPLIIAMVFYSDLLVYSYYVDLGRNFVPEPPTQVVPS